MPTFDHHPHATPNWIDLAAHDAAAAAEWYGALFGWSAEEQDTGDPSRRYWMFLRDGHPVAGLGQTSEEMKQAGVPPMWNCYVSVDDCDAAVARAEELGGSVMMPPMDVASSGRMAWITDPEGAALGLWQAGEHIGATLCNEPNTWCWNELVADDAPAAARFYGGLFGWGSAGEGPVMLQRGDHEIAHVLQKQEDWKEVPSHWLIYFAVADIEATVAAVQGSGGSVEVPIMEIPVGRFALLADPQGARFYVIQLATG